MSGIAELRDHADHHTDNRDAYPFVDGPDNGGDFWENDPFFLEEIEEYESPHISSAQWTQWEREAEARRDALNDEYEALEDAPLRHTRKKKNR